MLNLFYSEAYWGHTSRMNGPRKVIRNLTESLKQEGIEFAVNEEKYKHNLVLQYDAKGHEKHSLIEQETCVIGPQVWLFDSYGQFLIQNPNYYKSIIAPSQWVKDLFVNKFGMDESKVAVWPVGIDLKPFKKDLSSIKYDCLLYYKRRSKEELEAAIRFLEECKMSYNLIEYGSYSQKELELFCDQSAFCFLLNGTESQGIAVQEMMARDMPMFVWDIKEWNDQGEQWRVPATSIPYWSDQCGVVFYDEHEMEYAFNEFCDKIYTSRKYVEENLSYKKSVNILLEIFNAA